MSIIVDFRAKDCEKQVSNCIFDTYFALFQRRFFKGFSKAILPPKSSVKTALSSGLFRHRQAAVNGATPPLLECPTPRDLSSILLISRARVIIIALVSRKKMPPRRAAYRSHFTLRKSFVRPDESRIACPLPSPRCRRCPTNPARSRRYRRSPPCAPCACSWAEAAPLATART